MGGAALSIALAAGLPFVWRRDGAVTTRMPAHVDANFTSARFAAGDQIYDSESAFLAAVGAVRTGAAMTFGPILLPDAPELLANWDFADGTTGWTAGQVGGGAAAISAAGGELTLTANATVSAQVLQTVATALGAAYRLEVKSKRGTLPAGQSPGGIGFAAATAGITKGANATSYLTDARYIASYSNTSMSFGGRVFGSTDTGTALFDTISLKPVVPFAGYQNGGFAFIIKGRTPVSAPGAAVVLFQADSNYFSGSSEADLTANNRVRVAYDSGTGRHLRLAMSFAGSEVVAFDFGVIEFDTAFEIVVSVKVSRVMAALVGAPVLLDTNTSGGIPGVAAMRVGRTAAGEQWTGAIERVRLYPGAFTDAEFYTYAMDTSGVVAWGDSLTAGAGSTGGNAYPAVAGGLFEPDRAVVNLGIGGQTSTQIAARMNAQPILVTVSGNQIPASAGVAVTDKTVNVLYGSGVYTGTQTGWLAGVHGTMSTDAAGNWTFTRTKAGEATTCPAGTPFICELGEALKARTSWLWLGRNGAQSGYTVEDDIAEAIAHLGHDRYLVGAALTSTGDSAGAIGTIEARNATLSATYGARFVNLLQVLKDANDGSSDDLADIAAGYVPRSLRSDAVHLNDPGYAIVAAAMRAAHLSMGW